MKSLIKFLSGSKNKTEFSNLVWTKEDVQKWKTLNKTDTTKEILRLWYIEVYTSTHFPIGVNNQLKEEEIEAEVERILMSYSPPRIRNKKRIVTILLVLGILASIGIYYAVITL